MSCKCSNCRRDSIMYGINEGSCDCCQGALTKTSQFSVINDSELVCNTCFGTHYTPCPTCGTKQNQKLFVDVIASFNNDRTGAYVPKRIKACKACIQNNYRKCSCCGETVERHYIKAAGDNTFCVPCFNKTYQSCGCCGGTFLKTETPRIVRMKPACENCWNIHGPIGEYEAKAALKFHGAGPYFLGVELEVEIRSGLKEERGQAAQNCIDLLAVYDREVKSKQLSNSVSKQTVDPMNPADPENTFVITKHDGSLTCGFEICSQPATLDEHVKRWDNFFDKKPANLVSYETPNCGLHVHISRRPLNPLTVAKILVFTNDTNNTSFIETIAGRKQNKYCVISQKRYGHVLVPAVQRREAINLMNAETVEFRIFKGTLKRESFYKALEFCDAIVQFCMSCRHSIRHCRDKQHFIEYVGLRAKDYPHLHAFICAKVLKKETPLTKKFGFTIPKENTVQDNDRQT